jgi:GH35 family endo-1,4-beta-xylanase
MRHLLALFAAIISFSAVPEPLTFLASEASIQPIFGDGHLYKNGEVAEVIEVTQAGPVTLRVRAKAVPAADGTWPIMTLRVDDIPWQRVEVNQEDWAAFDFTFHLTATVHKVGVGLENDPDGEEGALDLHLGTLSIEPGEGSAFTKTGLNAWVAGAKAREDAVLALTSERIREHRTGPATITVRDGAGKALAGARVSVRHTRHAFLFGANICGWEQFGDHRDREYLSHFRELFNYATLPFYWPLYEPEQGRPNYAHTEAVMAWCKANHIEMKAHTVLWNNENGIPPWSDGKLPGAAVQEKRVRDLLGRFAGDIRYWEIVNEPVNQPGIDIGPPHHWAREAAPEAQFVLNEYGIVWEGHPEFFHFCAKAIQDGVPIDALGFQAHAPLHMAFPADRVWAILDNYATLGKAIHLTEFTPGSNGLTVQGAPWRGAWTAEQQAEYAEVFYRTCFAHPAVEAISWWDFSDHGAWVDQGGLITEHCTPKPAYARLKQLIKSEWTTQETLTAGDNGTATFRGYYGDYEVIALHEGVRRETAWRFEKGGEATLEIVME